MADADEPREPDEALADGAEAEASEVATHEPVKRPKKRRASRERSKSPDASTKAAPLPGAGTPEGDRLREAFRAFEVGDYARAGARTRELRVASDAAVRDAAAELASRMAIDPLQVIVIVACAAVLAVIVYVWVF